MFALEGAKYGNAANAIAPVAATRLMPDAPSQAGPDSLHVGHVAPLVAVLCHESCPANGGVFVVGGVA